jgi:competence protein ComEC
VLAFEEEGLGVGNHYPVEQDPGWEESPVPNTFEEGTRFEIPSLGRDAGGRVFVFESRENLAVIRDYYREIENLPVFGPALHSHLYEDGLVLVHINGELPKREADRYGEMLDETV